MVVVDLYLGELEVIYTIIIRGEFGCQDPEITGVNGRFKLENLWLSPFRVRVTCIFLAFNVCPDDTVVTVLQNKVGWESVPIIAGNEGDAANPDFPLKIKHRPFRGIRCGSRVLAR